MPMVTPIIIFCPTPLTNKNLAFVASHIYIYIYTHMFKYICVIYMILYLEISYIQSITLTSSKEISN